MNLASYIDHTILKPDTTIEEITQLCEEAIQSGFAAVCIPPYFVKNAATELKHSRVKIAAAIGFPFGYNATDGKQQEIRQAIEDGADELDMVHNIAAFKNKDWEYLSKEIAACIGPVKASGKTIKIIVESGMMNDEELTSCCDFYNHYDIDFMKTSTGYYTTGATVHAINIMRQNLIQSIAIKASGGIRSFAFAKELVEAGANRIGASASLQILAESKNQ